jgi:hypothetical protein
MWNQGLLSGLKGLRRLMEGAAGPELFLEEPPDEALGSESGLVIQWSVGPDVGRVDLADAVLAECTSPEDLRRIVRFCARRRLPVEVWLLSGVWCVPARIDEVARWLVELNEAAGAAKVWVDPLGMSGGYKRRLRAHLQREGCEISGRLID